MQPLPVVPHPALGRSAHPVEARPRLCHSLHQERNSFLSLAADAAHIYSGSQGDDIEVWDKATFRLKTTLRGHTGSVLALEYAEEREWLFSASEDSTVRVWCTRTHVPLYIVHPHLETDSGDLFSLAWAASLNTIYIGCQNTSLQWFTFPPPPSALPSSSSTTSLLLEAASGTSTPSHLPRRVHKFFDSYPRFTRRPADLNARNSAHTPPPSAPATPASSDDCVQHDAQTLGGLAVVGVPPENVIWSAHYGYVYCMALVPSPREGSDDPPLGGAAPQLVTGSGDATVKLWQLSGQDGTAPLLLHTFDCAVGAVLALVVRGDTVYAGCQDGQVKVWDLETRTLVRSLIVVENVDILSLSMLHSDLYTCSANGEVQCWSASFELTASWRAHEGIVLSSIVTRLPIPGQLHTHGRPGTQEPFVLVTGANDGQIKVWEARPPRGRESTSDLDGDDRSSPDTMLYALAKFISIPSVSKSSAHREDCRQAAIWLRKCLTQLGAEASLVPTGEGTNPLVLATFRGTEMKRAKPRILFYGHYDVISAPTRGWASDPFTLSGRNGYLYGRGATDNKGPVIAVACAAAELLSRRALELDLVLLIEGEEEAGSGGFNETVRRHKAAIGPIDAILVSNSTWIAEDIPCITYGLRGVVHCNVEVSSGGPDLHSGVDGGATTEPMLDMIKLLGTLTDQGSRVAIPGFYESVRPQTDEERQLYTVLAGVTQTPAASLASRWREPALTIHNVEVSGPRNSTVIPATVKAHVSIRIVPDQDLGSVADALRDHLETAFRQSDSTNQLKVDINRTADWWLGSLSDPWFHALEDAVRDEWGMDPLRIREGGSIPSVPWLEKEFSCHALHLPLGQSSDQAHLPNERISLANIRRGKSVVERFFLNVAHANPTSPVSPVADSQHPTSDH